MNLQQQHTATQKQLGQGGFGCVFRYRVPQTNDIVALKLFRRQENADEESQFYLHLPPSPVRDTRILKFLGNHSIPDPTAPNALPDIRGLKFEYFPLGDVEHFTKSLSPVLTDEVLSMWSGNVATGLAYFAQHHIVHFDIKPANLLVRSPDHSLVIGDLGLAVHEAGSIKTTGIRGTHMFASPEVLNCKGIRPVADVFSLGCSIFDITTGSPPQCKPWEDWGATEAEKLIVMKQRINSPIWPPALPYPFGNRINQLVRRMLRKNPNNRLTAQDVLDSDIVKEALAHPPRLQLGLTGAEVATAAATRETLRQQQEAQLQQEQAEVARLRGELQQAQRTAQHLRVASDAFELNAVNAKKERDAALQALAASKIELTVAQSTLGHVQDSFNAAVKNMTASTTHAVEQANTMVPAAEHALALNMRNKHADDVFRLQQQLADEKEAHARAETAAVVEEVRAVHTDLKQRLQSIHTLVELTPSTKRPRIDSDEHPLLPQTSPGDLATAHSPNPPMPV